MRRLKWFAMVLLALNLGIFLYGIFLYGMFSGRVLTGEAGEGRLPRVAVLERLGKGGENTEDPVASKAVSPGQQEGISAAVSDSGSSVGRADEITERPLMCSVIGWFERENQAEEALSRLSQERRASFVSVVSREVPLEDFYWVLVPPLPDRQAAIALFRELDEQGVESYVVPDGEQENAVSLGLFRSRASAERLLAQRTEQNINARLVILPRYRISYALVFKGSLEVVEFPVDALELGEQGRLERIEFSLCESLATVEKSP